MGTRFTKDRTILALVLALANPFAAGALDGFALTGNNWTYITPGRTNHGVLYRPAGSGPFPAVVISHGKGSSAANFILSKAQIMTNWGFVCIGPEYTHAAGSTVTNMDGASGENVERARECLAILGGLAQVDTNRIVAYGNSMGAFVTIALASAETQRIAGAAITAGGVIEVAGYAAPPTGIAAQVVAPFLILHGSDDTTVEPEKSLLLAQTLGVRGVPNRRIVFEGIDHGLHNHSNTMQTCHNLMLEWFVRHGVLSTAGDTPPLISPLAGLALAANTTSSPLPFVIGDTETAAATLTLESSTSRPGLVPTTGMVLGGSGSNRTLSLAPATGATGTVTLAITVSDGVFTATTVFNLTVTGTVANAAADATPYRDQPRGIYVLDGPASSTNINGVGMRDGNLRTNDFVAGYALRVAWTNLEPVQDQFDFTIIDWNVRRIATAGKKLSLLFMNTEPAWLPATTGVTTWLDTNATPPRNRAVPWDPFLLERFETVLRTLAEHEIDGVKLKDHPVLAVVNAGLAGGHLAIRDPVAEPFRTMSGYTRGIFTNTVLRNVRMATSNFPAAFVQIGFWPVTENQSSPTLWEATRQALLAEFDGVAEPRVGFWMENLSANRPAPGQDPISGKPNTNFAAPLYLSRTNTWVNFQALTSWVQPFNNYGESVTNATAGDGMSFAHSVYGSTYFELYVSDVDALAGQAELRRWNAVLFPPDELSLSMSNHAVRVQWPSWPGGLYQVERTDDHIGWTSEPPAFATNAWSTWLDPSAQHRSYRVRVIP